MYPQQDFTKTLLTLQRPINCLTDQDRSTRKSGLNTISSQMDNLDPFNLVKLFTQTNLQQYIVKRTLCDKIENNRELSLKIIAKFVSKVKSQQIKNSQIKPFIEQLVKRINNTPFPQTSEDLRLQIIILIQKMVIEFPDAFLWYIPELCSAMAKTLADPFADIKHASNSLVRTMCEKYKYKSNDNVGHHSLAIVKSLAANLTHQHSKVRKGSLVTAGKILIAQNAGNNFQQIQVSIKSSLGDKSADVRKQALLCISCLLKGFGPKYMKMYEAVLVGYLLSGLSDQNEQNVKQALKQLQQCGQAVQQMVNQQNSMQNQTQ